LSIFKARQKREGFLFGVSRSAEFAVYNRKYTTGIKICCASNMCYMSIGREELVTELPASSTNLFRFSLGTTLGKIVIVFLIFSNQLTS
jgi:hypothetical protein